MARTAYWIANPTSTWAAGTLSGAEIAAGLMADGTTSAQFSGSEPFTATTGTDSITEATATSGATAGISYTVAWVIYDDVAANYSNVTTGTFTTDPFTSTGALSAQAATAAGTAAHYTLHASTGALAAGAAVVSGTAERIGTSSFDATGALSAQAATVAGTAAHLTLHTSTGALSAQAATVAGTAAHYTLHTSTGALEAGSATVSGTAVDETTYVPPVPQQSGGGKSRKPRMRRYQVEIDGAVHEVESLQEAEEVLAEAAQKATETAKLAIERAAKAKRRPVRKIVRDAEKALEVPAVSVPPSLQSYADQMIGQIRAEYQSALSAIEIAAHMARREREIEEDDEEVLMLL